VAIALALISSVLWGTSDFIGGTVSKRIPSSTVLLWSSLAALPFIALITVVTGNLQFSGTTVGWGIVAGVSCSLGIIALYRGLATGVMGVVAPIASTSVLVPVVVGFARGDGPGPVRSAGIALAIIGVILAGGPHLRLFRTGGHRPILLALAAALGIGISLLAVANGSSDNALSTLLVMRIVYPVLLITVVIVTRAPRVAGKGNLFPAAAAGIGDALAVTLYGVATRSGALPVVAALSSLFPVTTLVLARQIEHERLEREQAIGVALALFGVLIVVTSSS
jgi:drug/metabolite transporter (DMT)-like permease